MDHCDVVLRACFLALVVAAQIDANQGFGPAIDTTKGRVRGLRMDVHGRVVDAFLGIPYAKPPLRDLRFKHPVQSDPWSGILNTTAKPNACIQGLDVFYNHSGAKMWNANTKIDEDCLYLNVWAPKINPHATQQVRKSVMIWIFGGGFYSGSASLDVYDGRFLAAENDVVVVSMQYRLGALGFLSLFHRENPGNAGMFDQVMALDWVQQNIHNFGGNQHDVTLFGESAGAVSVGMHLLSPLSRGKFHRAILQSGAPHAAWGVLNDKEAKMRSHRLAEALKCNMTEDIDTLRCLRGVDASLFIEKDWFTIVASVVRFPFVPVVDGVFLTEPPERLLNSQKYKRCPVLLGHNTNEANYWLMYDYEFPGFPHDNTQPMISQTQYNDYLSSTYRFHPYYRKKLNEFGMDAIKFFYRNWKNPNDQKMNAWQIDMAIGDFNFICPTVDLAQHYASTGNDVYYYLYNHKSSVRFWPDWSGVLHADEINFVFGEPLDTSKGYSHEDKSFAKQIMKYWTNFAKTGNPNKAPGDVNMDEWPKYKNTSRQHIILEGDMLKKADKSRFIGEAPRARECAFWKDYLPQLVVNSEDSCVFDTDNPDYQSVTDAGTLLTTSCSLIILCVTIVTAAVTV